LFVIIIDDFKENKYKLNCLLDIYLLNLVNSLPLLYL
jgi:hypothetical protein